MYKTGDNVVIPKTNQIKVIKEIERFDDDVVIYTEDGNAYGIRECMTVKSAYQMEVGKLLKKWQV
jgi:hypothetical protein